MINYIKFNEINSITLNTQLEHELNTCNTLLTQLAHHTSSWQEIMAPLQADLYQLNQTWGLVNHLQSVNDSPELRQLHDKYLPIITEFYVNLGQNESLYQHITKIKANEFPNLDSEQQKIIENELRDFKLSGISLAKGQQLEYKQIQNRLSELNTKFDINVLDATDSYAKYVTLEELSGVPQDSINLYQTLAKQDKHSGFKISLHMPSYLPIMQYATNRQLREELYFAYITRASELDNEHKFDNSPIIYQILQLRLQKANLLGFNNYAQLSLATKMAESTQQITDFLLNLAKKAQSKAKQDLNDLEEYAAKVDGLQSLAASDIPYYSEKLQQHKYSYSSHELKQYFPLSQVLSGLFQLINQLYQIDFTHESQAQTWHSDVMCYSLKQNQATIGYLYYDFFARNGKQSGAWMNSAQERYTSANKLPIALVICNFTSPLNNTPSLLTFDEVQTLFHEMGHALHQLLTNINNPSIAGINGVEWDAVELPSQFMEHFAWDYSILKTLSSHIVTKQVLPIELFDKLLASRHYQAGLQTLRQVELALFDLKLHTEFNPHQDNYLTLLNEIRKQIAVIIPPEYNRFANSFSHIFAGGYAAGYYSYKWAEVLACDVFSLFEDKKNSELTNLGMQFRQEILTQGGLHPMMDNFKRLMGREPQIDALLKYSGL